MAARSTGSPADQGRPPRSRRVGLAPGFLAWQGLAVIFMAAVLAPAFVVAMSDTRRAELRAEVKSMFEHGYDNYMAHAFPLDELNPLDCRGRGPDREHPENININDVLGGFAMTLVDSLDTLAVLGNATEFKRGVGLIVDQLPSFDIDSLVSVFEVTIRMLGGLLSVHLLATDPHFAPFHPEGYQGELLHLAHDLGQRLLPAFEGSKTGLPRPRVNLKQGMVSGIVSDTCAAGAGTLTLEFGMLSRLTGDARFETAAKRAVLALWEHRTGLELVGNVINTDTGHWSTPDSGVGAGMDSFFEYLFKAHVLLGDSAYLDMFLHSMAAVRRHVRTWDGYIYRNVQLSTGQPLSHWIDSLSAYLPGLFVQAGDIEEAARLHAVYFGIWRKYGALPERFELRHHRPAIGVYPLRPELAESTYFLYQATRDPYYLMVGETLVRDLQRRARVPCGFATIRHVVEGGHEDRMESFFLSETLKYLYLLFDEDNVWNRLDGPYVLSTEGHLMHAPPRRTVRRGRPMEQQLARIADALPWGFLVQQCPAVQWNNPVDWATQGLTLRHRSHGHVLQQLIGWPEGVPLLAELGNPDRAAVPAQRATSAATLQPGQMCSGSTTDGASEPVPNDGQPSGRLHIVLGVAPNQFVISGQFHGMNFVTDHGIHLQLVPVPRWIDDWPEFHRARQSVVGPSFRPLEDARAHQCPAYPDVRSPGEAPIVHLLRVNGLRMVDGQGEHIMRVAAFRPHVVAVVAVTAYEFPVSADRPAFRAPSTGTVRGWSALFTPMLKRKAEAVRGFAAMQLANDGCHTWDGLNGDLPDQTLSSQPLLGMVLVVRRGGCNFADKVYFAQRAGAAAVLVVNDDDAIQLMVGVMSEGALATCFKDAESGPAIHVLERRVKCTRLAEQAGSDGSSTTESLFTIPSVMLPSSAGEWLRFAEREARDRDQLLFLHIAVS